MRKSILTAAAFLLLTGLAPAQPTPPPSSLPPAFTTVAEVKAAQGELVCRHFVMEPRTETRYKEIEMDGKKVKVAETVTAYATKTVLVVYSLKDAKAQTADGKPLAAEDLAKRLTPGSTILLASNGKIDPSYLKVVKPDTLILIATQIPPMRPPQGERKP